MTEVNNPAFKITPPGYDTLVEQQNFTEVAPVIPVEPRKPLEKLIKPSLYYGRRPNYNSYEYRAFERKLAKDRSPRLNSDPSAELIRSKN